MRILIIGPPGSGKSTEAQRIAETYLISHLDMGSILRAEMQKDTPLGKEIQKFKVDKGNYVPDDIAIQVAEDQLKKAEMEIGFVFEGFPRTRTQAIAFDNYLRKKGKKITLIINLRVDDQVAIKRLSNRRICSQCGHVFNLISNPPKNENVCDRCGGTLIQRKDDTSELIKRRLKKEKEIVKPEIDFFRRLGEVMDVDANKDVDEVFIQIKQKLDKMVK